MNQIISLKFFCFFILVLIGCAKDSSKEAVTRGAGYQKAKSYQIHLIPLPQRRDGPIWTPNQHLPAVPAGFPETPERVRATADTSYVPWLARVFLDQNQSVPVRLFALMKYKQEYYKNERYQTSIEADVENIINESEANLDSLYKIHHACMVAEGLLGAIATAQLLAVAVPTLVQFFIGGAQVVLGPVTGNVGLAFVGGGTASAGGGIAIASAISIAEVQAVATAVGGALSAKAIQLFRRYHGEEYGGGGGFRSNRGGGGNHARNGEVTSIVKELGLNKKQQRMLHDEITGQEFSRDEIYEIALAMFGKPH